MNTFAIVLSLIALISSIAAFVYAVIQRRRQRSNAFQRAVAAEDMLLYGSSFIKITPDGRERRVDPRDIYFDMDDTPANRLEKP
jgi:hypothetical protein